MPRKSGPDVWEYRYRNRAEAGSPMRQITLSTVEYPTETKALIHLQELLMEINGAKTYRTHNVPTMGLVIDRFMNEERIEDIVKQKPGEITLVDGLSYSTARGYRSYITRHIKPKCGAAFPWWKSRRLRSLSGSSVCLFHQRHAGRFGH
jgi:hypothetical protein